MTFSWLPDLVSRDIDRMLHYTLLWGFEAVDLRMVGNSRVPHVNEEKVLRRLQEAEITVAAVSPGLFEGPAEEKAVWLNEVAQLPDTLRFCQHVGCSTILVSGFQASDDPRARENAVDAFKRAAALAERKGIALAVCNESDGLFPTAATLAALLEDVGSEALRASWSPAQERIAAGSVDHLKFDGKIIHVRVAQITGASADHAPSALESGVIDWPGVLSDLRKDGFDGTLSMETRAEPIKKQGIRDATLLHQLWRKAKP
jgi:sugar phosphate isomerase/epimerase